MSKKLTALIMACGMTFAALPLCVQAENNIEYAVESPKDSYQNVYKLSDYGSENSVYLMSGGTGTLSAYFEGEGTKENPYLLSTPNQFTMLAALVNMGKSEYSGAHYKLTNSIDFAGENFVTIGRVVTEIVSISENGKIKTEEKETATYPFKGHFDGNGYALKNITIDSSERVIGVFGIGFNACVENLRIENITINASRDRTMHIGGLFGRYDGNWSGENLQINGCHVDGKIVSRGGYNVEVGGMVGKLNVKLGVVKVSNCRSDVDIDAVAATYQYAGGLIGNVENGGDISKCVATGSVYGETTGDASSYAGGITARLRFSDWIGVSSLSSDDAVLMANNGYSKASQLASAVSLSAKAKYSLYTGNIIAQYYKDEASVSNCYYDKQYEVTPTTNAYQGTGKETVALFDKSFLKNTVGLDFENTWTMVLDKPELVAKDPYIACELSGTTLNVQPVKCGDCKVIVAVYKDKRLVTSKVEKYTEGIALPVSLDGLTYDEMKIFAVNDSLSPLCNSVTVK